MPLIAVFECFIMNHKDRWYSQWIGDYNQCFNKTSFESNYDALKKSLRPVLYDKEWYQDINLKVLTKFLEDPERFESYCDLKFSDKKDY